MDSKTRCGLCIGAGFLLGTVGLKALTSPAAKRGYVKAVAYGLQMKDTYEGIVEEAKAQVDDIVAEARYMSVAQVGEAEEAGADEQPAKPAAGKATEKKAK